MDRRRIKRINKKKRFYAFFPSLLKKLKRRRIPKEKKVLRPSDLRKRRGERRKRRIAVRLFLLFFLVTALAGGGWFVVNSDALTIQRVDVRNEDSENAEEIERFVFKSLEEGSHSFFPRTNTFFVHIRELEKSVADSSIRIERVNILRKGFDELIVVVEERKPAYIYCEKNESLLSDRYSGECFFADTSGIVYSRAPYLPRSDFKIVYLTPLIADELYGSQPLIENEIESLNEMLEILESEDIQAEKIYLSSDEKTLEVQTNESYSLLFAIDDDYTDELERFFSALGAEIFDDGRTLRDVYQFDLRFGRKVFYRYNESPTAKDSE
jgi:hypothetical protein